MKIINTQDFLQIRLESNISSLDIEFLVEFYGPIIGMDAIGLYVGLKQQDALLEGNFLDLATWLTYLQTTPQAFHQARIYLEAVGLLRTYQQTSQQTQQFTFSLYAPKNPQGFMDDPILKGLLIQRAGTTYLQRLSTKYVLPSIDPQAKEVSVSFGEVFHPDLNHPAFMNQSNPQYKGKTLAEIRQPFDAIRFAEQLKAQFSIDMKKLNADDMTQIIAIATLTGLDELAAADIVGTNLDMNHRLLMDKVMQAARQEKRLPFVRQRQQQKIQLQETSSQTIAINQMEMLTPMAFLSMKQQGAEVSPADFSLLLRLQTQYALPNPVINALIHHVLTTQNNVLSSRYVEKLAGSLKRENLQHAVDTMDYFFQINQPRTAKVYPGKKEETTPTADTNPLPLPKENEQVDDQELDTLESNMKGLK
jgi:replication initiation and membrane attachment protein